MEFTVLFDNLEMSGLEKIIGTNRFSYMDKPLVNSKRR